MVKTVLHTFLMGDCEDPYLYAAGPLWDWQQTEHGQWCMEHAIEEPSFICEQDFRSLGFQVVVSGILKDDDHIIFMLKYGNASK